MTSKFKVAAVHAAPVFMNKDATIQKVVRLIQEAAVEDIKLLVFPETYVWTIIPYQDVLDTTKLTLILDLFPDTL
jgi:predicted amidohydrolase